MDLDCLRPAPHRDRGGEDLGHTVMTYESVTGLDSERDSNPRYGRDHAFASELKK
jgi:hypothetical protein